ncbi:MAG: cytidine deaminase [Firmicutes bacterium HGW-Firmicutes-9]|jgi:dCMP deaminase|nr:MAG: cytidine deaminase [Firmicutes bacterium HGW-Firmicutes-9]
MERISKQDYYLKIASEVAKRSTCLRRQYGAVIVKNDEIIATGYNGAPRGDENCCDVGSCWRDRHNIPHGEQYEKCVAVHAEANAIISASRNEMLGSTLYLYGYEGFDRPIEQPEPCIMCNRLIKNAGIVRVINQFGEVTL